MNSAIYTSYLATIDFSLIMVQKTYLGFSFLLKKNFKEFCIDEPRYCIGVSNEYK